jgi:uncharacterized protein YbjT (DUF2867 family)
MKNVIITGATGMIGGIVLNHCLQSDEIQTVTSLVRRTTGVIHSKLCEIVCDDFLHYNGLEAHFSNQDIAHFCLGVYTGQVPDALFKEITVDYAQGFADRLKSQSPEAGVCFLSGAGADQSEKSRLSFARYKGMAENYLIEKNFKSLYLFRPGYIYPVEPRQEPNFSYRVSRWLYPLIKVLGRRYSIKSTELGEAMFIAGIRGAEKMVLENNDILDVL